MANQTVNVDQKSGSMISKRMKWCLVYLAVGSAMTKLNGDWSRVIGVGIVVGAFVNMVNHLAGDDDTK